MVGVRHPVASRHGLDVLGTLLAIGFGLPSLLYPFGSDQAVYHYVGTGWLEGLWPYVDALDIKPPGIYFVYALAARTFGAGEWPIRAFELAAVVAVGWVVAAAIRPNGERRDGERGVAALLAAGWYYTVFDYWATAQVELWEGLFLASSWAVAIRGAPTVRRIFAAGALCGIAFLFKYPAVLVGLVIALVCARRRENLPGALSALGVYGAGVAVCIALCLAPFAWNGDLASVWDSTVAFNLRFSTRLGRATTPWAFWIDRAWIWGLLTAAAVALGVARSVAAQRRGEAQAAAALARAAEIAALLAAAWASVLIQRKFWAYHHEVLVPFAVASLLWGLRTAFSAHPGAVFAAALAMVGVGFSTAPGWLFNELRPAPMNYRTHAVLAWRHARGDIDREQYVRLVSRSPRESSIRELGKIIASEATPGDTLCVLGYQPLVYTVSGLRCTSRVFVTLVLSGEASAHRGGAWVSDHLSALRSDPPTFFLVPEAGRVEIPGAAYRDLAKGGGWVVLRREPHPPRGQTGSA
ncbi:MAG: glycosyltransferase family 39 protein [Deltaproteobacteria bacterium]|nr:glycosyltransferase family 39 protein [Deltaproteobacteria bacterium]